MVIHPVLMPDLRNQNNPVYYLREHRLNFTDRVDAHMLAARSSKDHFRPLDRSGLLRNVFWRQLWRNKSRWLSIVTAVFFGVTAATIALILKIGDSDMQFVFWFSAIACLITGIVNIRQTVIVAGLESRKDYTLLLLMGEDPIDLEWTIRLQTLVAATLGSFLGVGVGVAIVSSMIPWLRTLDGGGLNEAALNFSWWSIPVAVIGGLLASMIASWGPSKNAAMGTLGERERNHSRISDSTRFLIGITVMVTGNLIAFMGGSVTVETAVGASALIVMGFYISFPILFRGLFGLIDKITRNLNAPVFKMAVRSVTARGTSAVAVATAFTVGVMFLGAVTVVGSWQSDQDSLEAATGYNGTLKINNNANGSTPRAFRDSDVQEWAQMGTVDAVYEFQGTVLNVGKTDQADNDVYLYRIHAVKGSNPFEDMIVGHPDVAEAYEEGQAIVGSKNAEKYGLKVGQKLTVKDETHGKNVVIRVGAIIDGYSSDGIFVSDSAYKLTHATSAYIVTTDPNDHGFVRAWRSRYGKDYVGEDRESRIKSWGASALQTLLVEYAAASLVITVSVLGLMTMMTLSIMQRKRELGLLSAYGMSGMQLKRSLWMEAVMITGFAGLSSTIAGSVVGVIVGMSTIGGGGFPLLLISWLVVASIVIGWVSAFIPGIIVLRDGAHGIRDE